MLSWIGIWLPVKLDENCEKLSRRFWRVNKSEKGFAWRFFKENPLMGGASEVGGAKVMLISSSNHFQNDKNRLLTTEEDEVNQIQEEISRFSFKSGSEQISNRKSNWNLKSENLLEKSLRVSRLHSNLFKNANISNKRNDSVETNKKIPPEQLEANKNQGVCKSNKKAMKYK